MTQFDEKTREQHFKEDFTPLDPMLAWHAVSVLGHPVWAAQYCANTLEDEFFNGKWVPNFTTIEDVENMSFEEFLEEGPFAVYCSNYESDEAARIKYYAVSYALTAVDHAVFAGYGIKPSEAPTSRYKFVLNLCRDMLEQELASLDTE